MRLFRINKKNHTLELLKEELLCVKEFEKVIHFSTGDIKAEQYFKFIYFYCDYSSPYYYHEEEIKFRKSCNEADLRNWKPDAIVKDAIKKYLELSETPAIISLKNMTRALDKSAEVIDIITKRLDNNLKYIQTIDISTVTEVSELELYNNKFKMITMDLDYITGMGKKLNTTIEEVTKIQDKVIKDDFQKRTASGDKEIGNRADP